jgi:phosphatidylinositol alpha-mannosyltransferase
MRIALLHPTYWPEVRRGSERLAHDLGTTLAQRGHDVTLLTSHRAWPTTSTEDGMRVRRSWRPPTIPGLHWYEDHVVNVPAAIWRLLRGEFDLAHALFPADAWAALQARRRGGPPYVFSIHGIINREALVRRRYRIEMFRDASAGAAATSALSEAAVEPLRRYLLATDPVVLPGGMIGERFAGPVERAPEPTVICPASLDDARKRGHLLLEAFALVRERRPDARLVLAGGRDPFSAGGQRVEGFPDPGSLPEGVTASDPDDAGLAAAYRRAWVTVLPSIDEAFGLVLVESLAAGTPVVGARSGACPELVTDDAIGRLYEPDDAESLAAAIEAGLELAGDPDTVDRCRAAAEPWDWQRVIERYETVYRAAAGAWD